MDLEATWQEHKKFITSVGVGALVFGIFASGIKGLEQSAEGGARANARSQTDLLSEINGLTTAEKNEKGRKKALEEKAAPEIKKAVIWTVPPEFVIKPDDPLPTATYEKLRSTAAEEIGKKADKLGAILPRNSQTHLVELRLASGEGLAGPVLNEKCARIDLTTKILQAVLDAGIKKVDDVKHGEAGYQQLEGDEGFLRRIPVGVTFEGTLEMLAKVLAAFEQENGFLEVEGCDIRRPRDARPDGTESRLAVTVTFTALTVEKDAPADALKDKPGKKENDDTPAPPKHGHHKRGDR